MSESPVAVITGAGSGIGKATAVAFAAAGYRVVAVDLDLDRAAETARLAGPEALSIGADVTRGSEHERYVNETLQQFGRIDAFFNNAGIAGPRCAWSEHTEEEFDQVIAVNLKGVWLGIKHVGAVMVAQGFGSIVNTSSIASRGGPPNNSAYCASKGGVAALTACAAREFVEYGVRVNAVAPGVTDTPLVESVDQPLMETRIPMKRYARPEEIADAVLFLASPQASYVTGQQLFVDGGWSGLSRF